jgi:Lipase (class 3)
MAFPSGYVLQEAQEAIALSYIAYQGENLNDYDEIKGAINSSLSDTLGQGTYTQLVWLGISSDFSNLLYVVQDTSVANRYALVARGTDWNFLTDWVDDFDVLNTQVWIYASPPDPSILVAQGSWDGLHALLNIKSQPDGVDLFTLLPQLGAQAGASGLDLLITGHSLGGALATILGLYLSDTVGKWSGGASPISLKSYTFAAPTTGNAAYADYYNGRSGLTSISWEAYRIYNSQDIVPFAYADIEGIADNGMPLDEILELEVSAMTALVQATLTGGGVSYTQVGNVVSLDNTSFQGGPPTCTNPATSLDEFACWVTYEHSYCTYMRLLGLTVDCQDGQSTDMSSTSSANHPRLEAKAAALRAL